jgi:hypothetical protein
MSSSDLPVSSLSKRRRIVEGSCWPCKQRRVKCDLKKPSCRRCIISGTEDCSYNKLFLRWKARPSKQVPDVHQHLSFDISLNGISLATNQRSAIEYFKDRLWPLFSTGHQPAPPPVALALRSQPVLQALCVFAEEHRALEERGQSTSTLDNRRLRCLTAIRGQLSDKHTEGDTLFSLLVAVLLLYFLEGYVNCTNDDASTQCHAAGALAIIDALGGFEATYMSSDRMTRMLLSEFASTDLTDAMLQDRKPSFPVEIWNKMEPCSVWWESPSGTKSLATVLSTMAAMATYHQDVRDGANACSETVQAFERALQPSYTMLDYSKDTNSQKESNCDLSDAIAASSLSLYRAFQHAGLIYLYRAITNIPTQHFLVQQHVHACLECIQGMDTKSRVQNCALFPLYIIGAHALTDTHRTCILERLDIIYTNLKFQSVRNSRIQIASHFQDVTTPLLFADFVPQHLGFLRPICLTADMESSP